MNGNTVGGPRYPVVGAGARPILSSEISEYRERTRSYGSSPSTPATRSGHAPFLERRGSTWTSSSSSSSSSSPPPLPREREQDCRLPWDQGLGSTLVDAIHALEHTRPRTQTYSDSFVPNPKLTFLLENPRLECRLCFLPTAMTRTLENSTISILFCGHFACHLCLGKWLAENDTCPFCRKELRHEKCGHTVEPREVTNSSLISIPSTSAAGGRVANTCRPCHRRAAKEKAPEQLQTLLDRYVKLRDAAGDDGGVALGKAQARLERFRPDLDYNQVMRDRIW
jgi:hypothetical protein